MTKHDMEFRAKIKKWLESDDRSDEAILEGALLVLQLNRNKYMYAQATRKPKAMAAKIEYELKKHLTYYNDNMTLEEVERMTQVVIADVKPAIEEEQKVIATEEPETLDKAMESRRGKREDHNLLDPSVRALWDKNTERWKKIKELYTTCLQLQQPCDRYEYLKMLKEIWYQYKADMKRYDEAKADTVISETDDDNISNEVKSARPYISKNLPVLEQLTEDGSNEAKRKKLIENIQKRVDILINANEVIKDETKKRLAAVGINVDISDNAEG